LPESFKVCPICETVNHRNASLCVTCGTTLMDVEPTSGARGIRSESDEHRYDYRFGETDLQEEAAGGRARAFLLGTISLLVCAMVFGISLIAAPFLSSLTPAERTLPAGNPDSGPASPRPTLSLATVTLGAPTDTPTVTPSVSPTITETPTREPCRQVLGAGEGLYAVIARCGHRDLAVVEEVVRLNNLNDETSALAGQTLIIPWPTETPDPVLTETAEAEAAARAVAAAAPEAGTPPDGETADESVAGEIVTVSGGGLTLDEIRLTQAVDPFFRPTATNPPGIMGHTVATGETITEIIVAYNTSMGVLDQLNPEVTFSQCEFGERFGGGRCIVLIAPGQVIRVPAPTPTPTLSPTPNGSETPTPTATATYNAPYALSPDNRAYFRRDELVTLRWASTGFLLRGEAYRIDVENIVTGQKFSGETTDLSYVLPREWQPAGTERGEYLWTVSVVSQSDPDTELYTTESRTFTWEGLQNAN
jgi:LysM repeat protein